MSQPSGRSATRKKVGGDPDSGPRGASSQKSPNTQSEETVTTSEQISEHALPGTSGSTSGGYSGNRHSTTDRRTAMGIAAIRIAGRLTQNELSSRDARPIDASTGPDELLQLLGEYLTSGGLQSPELHVRSNGTSVVLDLLNPAKGFR